MNYQLGNYVRVSAIFKNLDAQLVDPTTVTVQYTKPNYPSTLVVASRLSVGSYYCDILADTAGRWNYRVVASGNVVAAAEGEFGVHSLKGNY
jgi:hypothetical protein